MLLPDGKTPDPEYSDEETMMVARVPIYGTTYAGRFFWKQMRETCKESNLKENEIAKATLACRDEHDNIIAMLGTHVDDLLWAATPQGEQVVQCILDKFNVRKIEEDDFRLCGKEIKQDKDFTINVTCKDTSEKVDVIHYNRDRKRHMTELTTEAEIGQMRSVVGSLAWIVRQCRPDLSYEVSRAQSRVSRATVQDLKDANKAVKKCREKKFY